MAVLLKTYATMTKLKRLQSGVFTIENALKIEDLESGFDLSKHLIKPDSIINLPSVNIPPNIIITKTKSWSVRRRKSMSVISAPFLPPWKPIAGSGQKVPGHGRVRTIGGNKRCGLMKRSFSTP